MIPFGQHSAPDFIQKAIGIKNTVVGVKDGLETAIEAIGEMAKIILNCIDWTKAIIKHPIIAFTFIDRVSMIVLMVLFILKILGFEELDRYIWFYKNRKTFEAYDEINLTELKAIKQQCKELGWINE